MFIFFFFRDPLLSPLTVQYIKRIVFSNKKSDKKYSDYILNTIGIFIFLSHKCNSNIYKYTNYYKCKYRQLTITIVV